MSPLVTLAVELYDTLCGCQTVILDLNKNKNIMKPVKRNIHYRVFHMFIIHQYTVR